MTTPKELGTAIHEAIATGQIDASLPKELRDAQRNAIAASVEIIEFKCRPDAGNCDVVNNPQVELYKEITGIGTGHPRMSADELRAAMAFDPKDWAHGPASMVTASAPCAGHSKPLAPKRPSSIVSISQAELDQLLAPYIRYGLLCTIYTRAGRATEYRGPSGKVIAITIGRNHYRNRDAVLGSTPLSLTQQCIGRVRRTVSYDLVNPKTGEVVGGGTIPGNVTILHGSV